MRGEIEYSSSCFYMDIFTVSRRAEDDLQEIHLQKAGEALSTFSRLLQCFQCCLALFSTLHFIIKKITFWLKLIVKSLNRNLPAELLGYLLEYITIPSFNKMAKKIRGLERHSSKMPSLLKSKALGLITSSKYYYYLSPITIL